MKNYLFIIALLFLFSNCSTSDPETAKAEALKSINSFYDAMTDFDYDLVRTYCTDNFYFIDDGQIHQNIDEFIAMLKTYEGADIKVSLEVKRANMGIKSGLITLEFVADILMGKDKMKVVAIENYVLKKEAGKWLIGFIHSAYLTDTKKLEKGSILGIHILSDIELMPGVTNAQVEEFLLKTYFPAFNELAEDFKMIPLKGLRGDNADELAYIMYLESDDARNSYWSSEGVFTPKGQELFQKFESVRAEREKLFTSKKDPYTDWRVE